MATQKQLHSLVRDKIDAAKHETYTALPGKIVTYDPNTQTCTAKPMFKTGDLEMPPIYHVPVIFPAGGGAVMTFPVKSGDLCWLSFSMYPLDELISGTGDTVANNNSTMARPHDYNECVAYVGLGTTKANYQPDPTKVMIRYGKTKFTMDDQGQATLDGSLHITKKLTVDDTIVAKNEITGKDFVSSTLNVSFNQHRHHYFWTDPGGDADSETPS